MKYSAGFGKNDNSNAMGLDVYVCFDNNDQVFNSDYRNPAFDHVNKHGLSRTFCNFMCRKAVVSGEPELDQIGKLLSVDISPIYQLESYGQDETLEFMLETGETEEERQEMIRRDHADKDKLKGNLDNVILTITNLADKLSRVDNLPALLTDNGYDTLENGVYFADFNRTGEQDYVNNNFGQDLRNLRRLLEFAKTKGSTTVYFTYG